MPLPPALLQRLAKRGIVDKPKSNAKVRRTTSTTGPAAVLHKSAQNEEIIAENYDDDEDPVRSAAPKSGHRISGPAEIDDQHEPYPYDYEPVKKPAENFWSERLKRRIVDSGVTAGYRGCPNKYNIHHKCTLFCMNAYGDGVLEPDREYSRRQQRLLKRYPLPRDWKEVWDYGCGVHYYWNCTDDTVSWLPPTHPAAAIGKAAAVQRRELEALLPDLSEDTDEPQMTIQIEGMNVELPIPAALVDKPPRLDDADSLPAPRAPPPRKPKARDLDKAIRSRSERRKRVVNEGALDPMDPASYSDIPRGKWSAGLDRENEKTGVDATASGSLFQMRPYPSPGAILAAQGKAGKPDSDGEAEAAGDGDV